MNYFTKFDSQLFSSLKSLRELELKYNQITELSMDSFVKYNSKLKEISLENNNLTSLDANAINKLCLKIFTYENNPISSKISIQQVKSCINLNITGSTEMVLNQEKLMELIGGDKFLKEEEYEFDSMGIENIDSTAFNKVIYFNYIFFNT
jgi:Leucine-rich repeat (LRR) protein